MSKCPGCNSVKISPFVDEGDGKCDKCHGTGLGDALDQFTGKLVGEASNCTKCYGTGQCQTCGGTGAVKEEATRRTHERARADEPQHHARESSSSDNSGAEAIGKLIGIVIVVAAVIWFVFSVAIPLVLINAAVIALVAGLVNRGWKKVVFPLSIAGSVLLVADVSLGWSTKTLVSHVSFFGGLIPLFFYLNILAGLSAAYFMVRDFLDARTPPETSAGEFTTRNMIAMGCLLLVGGLTVGLQLHFAPPGRFASQTIRTIVPTANRIPASPQGAAAPNVGGANLPSVQGSFPFASQRLLADSDLAGFSKADLKIMRNEVFARHGYIFRTPDMKAYFAQQSWYHAESSDVTAMLTTIEKYNVALIKKHE